jgi:hypothetical protein
MGVEHVAGPRAGHRTGERAAVWKRVSDVLDAGTDRSRGIQRVSARCNMLYLRAFYASIDDCKHSIIFSVSLDD